MYIQVLVRPGILSWCAENKNGMIRPDTKFLRRHDIAPRKSMPGSNVTQIVGVSTFIGIHFELRSTRIHHDFAGTIADEYGRAHFIHDLVRSSLTYKNHESIVQAFVIGNR